MSEPKTLLEAIQYFSDPENCRSFMVSVRWADEVVRCPRCGYDKVAYMEKAKLYFCPKKHDRPKFSLKVGTIFEDSPIALEKWLPAAWLIANCKNGISSYELARAIGVTQKSAWHILHRLRKAMKEEHTEPMGGAKNPTEADECFLGGKPSNMHPAKRMKAQQNGQHTEKAIVFGLYERNTRKVRAKVIPNVRRDVLQAEILSQVAPGSAIFTDAWKGYAGLAEKQFVHETVSHINEYVRGQVSTQGIENFWSLLKRSLTGTYVSVEPFHLDAYLDEQTFRFNNRIEMRDADRFKKLMSQVVGKRLTYAELTGSGSEEKLPF
jgi:transposase-like protein